MISGIALYIVTILMAFGSVFAIASISRMRGLGAVEWMIFFVGIPYLALWFWQIFDARDQARKFNEKVQSTGTEPW